MRSRSFRLLLAVLALVLAGFVSDARAQMGALRAMAGGMTAPNVNARQLKLYAKLLDLTPEQAAAADDLLRAFEADYLAAIKRFQEIQQAGNQEFMQSGDAMEVQEAMREAMRKFNKRAESLETTLLNDLKTLLEPAQLERWPQLERMHRRMTTINWGSMSGESVDLVDLVDGLRLAGDQAAAVAPLLSQYEIDLDRELRSRNAIIRAQVDDWLTRNPMDFSEERMEDMKKQAADLREAGRRIMELNKRYAAQIKPLLPAPLQAEFADKVKLASYPIIYRKSHAAQVLEAALKLPDLDAGQREAIATLQEAYLRDAAPINDEWAAAITENELKPADDNPFAAFMPGRQLPEGITKAKESREALDKRTIDAVKALLTEEQRAKLPERKYRPELDFDAPGRGN